MLNSLTTATDGYLGCATKRLLVIAVAGYLNFCGAPSPSADVFIKEELKGGGKRIEIPKTQDEGKRLRLLREDDEILTIIKIFTEQCL